MSTVRLYQRGGVYHLDAHYPDPKTGRVGRARWSLRTRDPVAAERERITVEARLAVGHAPLEIPTTPTLGQAVDAYLEDIAGDRLSPTTERDRESILRGPAVSPLAGRPIGEITADDLGDLWRSAAIRDKSPSTQRNYLVSLVAVWRHYNRHATAAARAECPVPRFRELHLGRRSQTSQDRDEAQGGFVHAISADDLTRLEDALERDKTRRPLSRSLQAAERATRAEDALAFYLMLDAGLRSGECGGLRWRCGDTPDERGRPLGGIVWGHGPDDLQRRLVIRETKPRGQRRSRTKSGRIREVQLSRRLRAKLRERWVEVGQPEDGYVLPSFDSRNFARRFRLLCKHAEAGDHSPKDLRDTYASQLLTRGFPLPYISHQLGHASTQVTERHYARYIPGRDGAYVEPARLEPGEVPADVLARVTEGAAREARCSTS